MLAPLILRGLLSMFLLAGGLSGLWLCREGVYWECPGNGRLRSLTGLVAVAAAGLIVSAVAVCPLFPPS